MQLEELRGEHSTASTGGAGGAYLYTESMPRPSPVTDALRGLIHDHDRHAWSLDELLDSVRGQIPGADFSTVFRAMTTLERAGVVDRVDLGDGKARYEVRQDHHEHIRCAVCGDVAEVPGCVVEDALAEIQRQTGYQVLSHQVVFRGVCKRCRKKGVPTGPRAASLQAGNLPA
ncbi:MAG: transcriptional repressor [Candidatus Dormibacteraeota bacterium]|nr:transcriptional repressor [Candidatus Dormibacteraeota bacterium]